MPFPPLLLLAALLAATVVAIAAESARRRRSARVYRALAVAHGWHYSPGDPLRVTPRAAAAWPVPGAAAVRVLDLLYRTDDAGHHYLFTAEYTLGVVHAKRRLRRAARFTEPRGTPPAAPVDLRLGPADRPLLDQYAALLADPAAPVAIR